jgi:hypothetical protein
MQKEEDTKRILMNYPIGTRIISQSNEPDPLLIGNVVSHEKIHHGIMLMIENDEGRRFTLLDKALALWAQEREDALRKLEWNERYNVMSKYQYFVTDEVKNHKETYAYKNRLNE